MTKTTRSPLPSRLRQALLVLPIAAALLAGDSALTAPPGWAATSTSSIGTERPAPPAGASGCIAWPLPDEPPGFAQIAMLVVGAVAIARGIYAVFATDRNRGAPLAGRL